jgi:hypothetical protein
MNYGREVTDDTDAFKRVVYRSCVGSAIQIWWRRSDDAPRINLDYFEGTSTLAATCVRAETLIAARVEMEAWEKDPPWDRSISMPAATEKPSSNIEKNTTTEYAGLFVRYTERAGAAPGEPGYVVIDENGANVMPGATYSKTREGALRLIDVYRAVDGDGKKFWHLLRAIQRSTGELK